MASDAAKSVITVVLVQVIVLAGLWLLQQAFL
jgi:hypothetical protein